MLSSGDGLFGSSLGECLGLLSNFHLGGGGFFLSTEKKEGLNTEYWVADYIPYSQGDYWRRRSRR